MNANMKIRSVLKRFEKDISFAKSEGFTALLCPLTDEMEACYIESDYDAFVLDELMIENDWDEAVLIELARGKTLIVRPEEIAA